VGNEVKLKEGSMTYRQYYFKEMKRLREANSFEVSLESIKEIV